MQNGVVVQLSVAEGKAVGSTCFLRLREDCRSIAMNAMPLGPVNESPPPAEISWEKLAAEAQYRPRPLAALCNVSLRTLQRHFQKQYGTTLSAWLNALRIARAYERIRLGETVKAVAIELGFKQLSHFSRAFKQAHGVTPRLVAAQYQSPLARLLSTNLPGVDPVAIACSNRIHSERAPARV
jgi:AraC-like DNA-binding protein